MTRFGLPLGAAAALLIAQPAFATSARGATADGATAEAARADSARTKRKPEKATSIPEPGTPALFLLGAAGLVIGRRLSRSKRRRSPDA